MKLFPIGVFIIFALGACSSKESKKTTIQSEVLSVEQNLELLAPPENEVKEQELLEAKLLNYQSRHSFKDYEVTIFKGRLAEPNFGNNPFSDDKDYLRFIAEGCKNNGINFGGKYTLFTKSCGMECQHLFMVDRKSGKVFTDINLSEGKYGYEFRPNSTMIIANSELFLDGAYKVYRNHDQRKPESYIWDGNKFELNK